jgi:hypothetical protein
LAEAGYRTVVVFGVVVVVVVVVPTKDNSAANVSAVALEGVKVTGIPKDFKVISVALPTAATAGGDGGEDDIVVVVVVVAVVEKTVSQAEAKTRAASGEVMTT